MTRPVAKNIARERERVAWELRSRGVSQAFIATQLGVTQQAVSIILSRAEKRVISKINDTILRIKVEQTQVLDHIIHEAMAEWERSKQPRKMTKVEGMIPQSQGVPGTIPKTAMQDFTQEIEEQTGNVVYLRTVMEAMAEVRKIWGIGTEDLGAGAKAVFNLPPIKEIHINVPSGSVDDIPVLDDKEVIDI